MASERIAIGRIVKPVGLQGKCAVQPFGATLSALELPSPVYLGRSEEDVRAVVLNAVEMEVKGPACHIEGCGDRTAAEALRDMLIFVDERQLPSLEKGQYYHFQLKGMDVFLDADAETFGTVTEVSEFPTASALEITGKNGRLLTIPLTADAVKCVDIVGKRIVLSRAAVEALL
jgi:16S rRNA processing protein RimM